MEQATVVVLVVVLACTVEDQIAGSCGLEGYRDGAVSTTPFPSFKNRGPPPASCGLPQQKSKSEAETAPVTRSEVHGPWTLAVIQTVIQNRALANRRLSAKILKRLKVRSWMVPGRASNPSLGHHYQQGSRPQTGTFPCKKTLSRSKRFIDQTL